MPADHSSRRTHGVDISNFYPLVLYTSFIVVLIHVLFDILSSLDLKYMSILDSIPRSLDGPGTRGLTWIFNRCDSRFLTLEAID